MPYCPVCGLWHTPTCEEKKKKEKKESKGWEIVEQKQTVGEFADQVWDVYLLKSPKGENVELCIMVSGKTGFEGLPDMVTWEGALDWEGDLDKEEDWKEFKERYPDLVEFLKKEGVFK